MLKASQTLPPADRLALMLDYERIGYQREYRFHPRRKWAADFFLAGARKLIVEVEGGGFVQGRHNRGVGMENDMEKYAEAMCLGYFVLRVTPRQIDQGLAVAWVKRLLQP